MKGRNQKPARTLEIAFEGPSNGAKEFIHETVDHVKEYVLGDVHTNGIEDFWALLKRSLKRTHVAAEPQEQPRGTATFRSISEPRKARSISRIPDPSGAARSNRKW